MLYTIKRYGDSEFELIGTFSEVKAYFNPSQEIRELNLEDFCESELLKEFDKNNDHMDILLETVNSLEDSGLEFYIDSTELDITKYTDNGQSLNHGYDITLPVDTLTEDEVDFLKENNFVGYRIYLEEAPNGDEIIIESYIDSPICEVVTVSEASKILGISERGVRDNCERGKYTCRKSASTWLIDRSTI